MASQEEFNELMQTAEKAAEIVQFVGPNKYADSDRRQAENYLLQLRQIRSPYAFCQYALESASTSAFMRYQIVCVFQEAILREWTVLDSELIEAYWKYLLDYACNHQELPHFIINELLITVSMVVKRGTFDGKSGETDKIYESVSNMIFSNDLNLISFACQILYNLCTEYCTTWRSSVVGLSWDFHVRAKRHFELSDLKKVFQLSLQVLHHVISSQTINFASSVQNFTEILISKFLNLVNCVLNWNFGSKYLPKRLTYSVEFAPAFSLHPPETWQDLFLNNDVLQFFFLLHDKVRTRSSLCHNSLQCLIQLASLCGNIFPEDAARDKYLDFFITNLVQLFTGSPSADEAVNFAEMAQKLLTYHHLSAFKRLKSDLFEQFYNMLTRVTCEFCCKATEESMKGTDSRTYQEAYSKLLEAWFVQIKAEETEPLTATSSTVKISTVYTCAIFDSYWRCHVSSPVGTRPPIIESESEIEIEDNVEDDKEEFIDVLHNIAVIGRHCFERNALTLSNVFVETINRCQNIDEKMLSNDLSYSSSLKAIHEDLHWILLIIGNLLTLADVEVVFYIPLPIFTFYTKFTSENSGLDINSVQMYLFTSLKSPEQEPSINVDVVSKLIGCVFRWSVLEFKLLLNKQFSLLSPQVAETTVWCLKRLLSAYCDTDYRYTDSSSTCLAKNALQANSELSIFLTEFILDKFFALLLFWNNEERLNKEAALMLVNFIETGRAEEVLKSGKFLDKVKNVSIQQLCPAARKDLLKSIVKTCSVCDVAALSNHSVRALNEIIMIPLKNRYEILLKTAESEPRLQSNETLTELFDLLDCFCGIVLGVTENTFKWLLGYTLPVLQSCVGLLSVYKSNQAAVDAVLQLYVDVTRKFSQFLYGAAHDDIDSFYRCILTMMRTYAANNMEKYTAANSTNIDDDKVSDLVLFLQMLLNLISKDIFILDSPNYCMKVSNVITTGLEIIIPIMNATFLQYPPISLKFYALITSLTQLYTEKVFHFSNEMRRNLLEAAKIGLTFDYGAEVVKSSLELIQVLATYVCQHPDDQALVETKSDLGYFIKPVFETCLRASCEVDLLHDASTTLYSLFVCNEQAYRSFVDALIAEHDDPNTRTKLNSAFSELVPTPVLSSAKYAQLRKQKITFRDKFEKFLDNVQGLLHIR